MGEIVPPSSYIRNDFYKIKVGSKHLKMSLYETENLINIYIGGPKLFCIHATVNKPKSRFVELGIDKLHIGIIEKIYYNQQCSLEHNFIRGVDTNMIIHLLCQYVRDKYPYVSHLKFNDASSRTCDNGTDVSLMVMTFLYSEITWYQKNFHAIVFPDQIHKLNDIIKKYNDKKKIYSWEDFNEIFIKGPLPLPEDEMKEIYDSAKTWKDFFYPILQKLDIATFCNFISPWLSTFIERVLKYDFLGIPYMFVLDKLPSVEYHLIPFITGGSGLQGPASLNAFGGMIHRKNKQFTKKHLRYRPRNLM
jgi:hypothetical protein